MSINTVFRTFFDEYKKTPMRIKVLDCFLLYALATAAVQVAYVAVVGTFPFNAFLAGMFSTLGFFALTACLRIQVDPSNKEFGGISPERAFADYVLANLVLHLTVMNFIG